MLHVFCFFFLRYVLLLKPHFLLTSFYTLARDSLCYFVTDSHGKRTDDWLNWINIVKHPRHNFATWFIICFYSHFCLGSLFFFFFFLCCDQSSFQKLLVVCRDVTPASFFSGWWHPAATMKVGSCRGVRRPAALQINKNQASFPFLWRSGSIPSHLSALQSLPAALYWLQPSTNRPIDPKWNTELINKVLMRVCCSITCHLNHPAQVPRAIRFLSYAAHLANLLCHFGRSVQLS